jgi:hypothetical protein
MEKHWRTWLTMMKMYKIMQFCWMQRGMWIMHLHGMVVIRKRSRKPIHIGYGGG